jgi:hypothetical protein
MKSIIVTAFFSLLIFCNSCKEQEVYLSISNLDTSKYINATLDEIALHPSKFHGAKIKTRGVFYNGFENFAIYSKKGEISGIGNSLWLKLNSSLSGNRKILNRAYEKTVLIMGVVDTSQKGHQSLHMGTLSDIKFIKLKNN